MFRRVITGRADGDPRVVSDQRLDPVRPELFQGNTMYLVWGAEEPVKLPTDGEVPAHETFFPMVPGGLRVIFSTILPDAELTPLPEDPTDAVAEAERMLPGITAFSQEAHADHATPSIDFVCVVSGKVDLEVSGGERVTLGPGDVAVQGGIGHRWLNPYPKPCTFFAVLYGAETES